METRKLVAKICLARSKPLRGPSGIFAGVGRVPLGRTLSDGVQAETTKAESLDPVSESRFSIYFHGLVPI